MLLLAQQVKPNYLYVYHILTQAGYLISNYHTHQKLVYYFISKFNDVICLLKICADVNGVSTIFGKDGK